MKIKFNTYKEEKLIISILQSDKNIKKKEFEQIDYGKLTKIASSHLLLPTLYVKFKKKNYLKYLPKDFKKYLLEIYKLNKKRNIELLKEAKQLENILIENNIKFIFLKGSFMLLNNFFEDIGERMVGDIDFLFLENDKTKLISVLNENNYVSKKQYNYWKTRHLRRFKNINKLFAIEPHTYLLRKNNSYSINSKKFMKKNNEFLLEYCISNFQINDYGNLYCSYSFRTINDYLTICNKLNKNNIFLKEKAFQKFNLVMKLFNVYGNLGEINFFERAFIYRLILKRKYKFYRSIDNLICDILKLYKIRLMQLIEKTLIILR